jgi:hypothetical protein
VVCARLVVLRLNPSEPPRPKPGRFGTTHAHAKRSTASSSKPQCRKEADKLRRKPQCSLAYRARPLGVLRLHVARCTLHRTLHVACTLHYRLHSVLRRTLHTAHCTLHSTQCIVHCIVRTAYFHRGGASCLVVLRKCREAIAGRRRLL